MPSPSPSTTPPPTTLLILGAGWTSTFLLPHLTSLSIPHISTSTTGRDGTIPFVFRPSTSPPASTDSTPTHPPAAALSTTPSNPPVAAAPPPPPSLKAPDHTSAFPTHSASAPAPASNSEAGNLDDYRLLPRAETILITFPLKGSDAPSQLIDSYRRVHGRENRWILLGSTGIWKGEGLITETSPYDTHNPRAVAEDRFLEILGEDGCVLCLAGLWGGGRHPRGWIGRVADTKEKLRDKKSLHLIHGHSVARAIVAAHVSLSLGEVDRDEAKGRAEKEGEEGKGVGGKRWIVTDGRVYDWWEVVMRFGGERERGWLGELMREGGVEGLPREGEGLGRRLDGGAFWGRVGEGRGEGLFEGEVGREER